MKDFHINKAHAKPELAKIKSTNLAFTVVYINGQRCIFYNVSHLNHPLGDMIPCAGGYVRSPADSPSIVFENGLEVIVDYGVVEFHYEDGTVKKIDVEEPKNDGEIVYPQGQSPAPRTTTEKWWHTEEPLEDNEEIVITWDEEPERDDDQ